MRVATYGVLILPLLFVVAASFYVWAPWNFLFLDGDYLSVSEVCRRWGKRPLDVVAFRYAQEDESARAAMACSLLKNQDDHIGIDVSEIRPILRKSYRLPPHRHAACVPD